jgi:hypothetical protein
VSAVGGPGAADRGGLGTRAMRHVVIAVLVRPSLWWVALGVLKRLAAPGWWRTSPRLPAPDDRLWEFRMVTAYGRGGAEPSPGDVISYLGWCRSTGGRHRSAARRSTGGHPGQALHHRRSD